MIRSLARSFFTPAVFILNHFRYPVKFFLISLLFILPLAISTYSFISNTSYDIEFAQKERIGIQYASPLRTLLQNVQQHRGLVSASFIDKQSFAPRIADKEKEILLNEKAMDAIDQEYGGVLATADEWKDVKRELERVLSRAQQSTSEESFQMHTALAERLVLFLSHIGDTSGLILDPVLDSYYLADMLINNIPFVSERLGQVHAFGLVLLQAKEITQSDKRLFANLSSAVDSEVQKINREFEIAYGYNPALRAELKPQMEQATKDVAALLSFIDTNIITTKANTLKVDEYYMRTTDTIDEVFRLHDLTSHSLDGILQAKIDKLVLEEGIITGLIAALLLLIMYFFMGLYISIQNMISILRRSTDSLAKGERVSEIQFDAHDELFEVAILFNRISASLSNANAELNSNIEKRIVVEKEMVAKQEELERFNKLMVGRELKMTELKKELEELTSRKERP